MRLLRATNLKIDNRCGIISLESYWPRNETRRWEINGVSLIEIKSQAINSLIGS